MDIRLHYVEKGQGMPLILLHGNGENGEYFENQMDFFAKKYRVMALDTRGHGKSPRGEGEFSIARFAEDLRAFMDEKGIERANILGFSDGGNIAMAFALENPQRVEKLVLNGANLCPAGVKRHVQWPIVLGYHVAKFFAQKSADAKKNAEMLGLMVNEPNIAPEELGKLKMPVLVIAGKNDMIREKHTRLIYESLPDAQLAILPGDHFVANKNAAAFNAAVGKFLDA